MAFEVATRKFIKAKEMAVGSSVEGYVVGKHNSSMYPDIDNLILRDEKGEESILPGSGTLKYFFKNGNKPGYYYRFTRQADKLNQRKQTVTQWLVEIDRTKKINDFQEVAMPSEQTDNIPF